MIITAETIELIKQWKSGAISAEHALEHIGEGQLAEMLMLAFYRSVSGADNGSQYGE